MNKIRTVDLAISASWIIPVIPRNTVLTDCTLVIDKKEIIDICPSKDFNKRYQANEHRSLPYQALIPGLINAHTHASMALLRGYADDKPLMDWLENDIWPAEQKWVDEEFIKHGSELAIAEMLLSGTTCFADMYFLPETTAQVALKAGIRAQLNFPILDYPNNWAKSVDESLAKGMHLHDKFRSHNLINIGFGPHAPYTVSDGPFMRVAVYAEQMQAPIQIHLHESAHEVEESLEQHKKRPIERLEELNILSPRTQCVHMTQVTEEDIKRLKKHGCHIVHCPESNLKLASGFCPVNQLLEAGINVALGTDGAASNNDLSLLSEAKTAALLAKAQSGNAETLSAHQALELATINGAIALGLEDKIGSLEIGKQADIVAIDLNDIQQQPLYNPVSQIIYTECSHKISNLWVEGRQLVKDRNLLTLDEFLIRKNTQHWQKKMNRIN